MKRSILTLMLTAMCVCSAFAQKYVVVDSEKIFKSIAKYNEAIASLDELSKQYQSAVDAKFEQVEKAYNSYMSQKASLSAAARTQMEQQILAAEKSATEYQESVFGAEGVIMKKRIELIQPIQNRVFAAIEEYAKAQGADMVVDKASNATLLYVSTAVDRTQAIIDMLK